MSILDEISAERQRQVKKGFTADHDDQHVDREIIMDYEWGASLRLHSAAVTRDPAQYRHDLVQVAAMIVAEIERLDREYQVAPSESEHAYGRPSSLRPGFTEDDMP